MNAQTRNVLKASLFLLSALVSQACESHSGVRLAADAGPGADSNVPSAAADSSPGLDGGAASPAPDAASSPGLDAASPAPDAGGCRGLAMPDVDCSYGTPSYICVERQGGWVWDYTCPQPPQDAAPLVDTAVVPSAKCQAAVDQLRKEMSPSSAIACTAVVRLDYQTLAIIAHTFVCGKYAAVGEASARSAANAVAFSHFSKPGDGTLLSGPTPKDQWVFYTSPGDFGGVASVSAHTGLTTFAGTILWMGGGEIQLPKTWSTTDLGKDCTTPVPRDTKTFDLSGGQADPSKANPGMQEATRIVHATALPTAFQYLGGIFGTTVLLYPRAVGSFDPKTAEFIVLLDGGWLE